MGMEEAWVWRGQAHGWGHGYDWGQWYRGDMGMEGIWVWRGHGYGVKWVWKGQGYGRGMCMEMDNGMEGTRA